MHRGILGGTFDPPHMAHLLAGEAAYRDLGLDVVTFLPAGDPWQKADRRVTAPEHRWGMTEAAVAGVAYFEADDRELRRGGSSYTVDTLATFPAAERVTLVLGADAAQGLPTWKSVDEVLARADVAVLDRPGADRAEVEAAVGRPLTWLDAPRLAISSTMLRARSAAGGSLRFLVPDAVWRYIAEHRLYADG